MHLASLISFATKAACLCAALTLSAPVYAQSKGSIVLLVDVSTSIGYDDFKLQSDAYARALADVPGLETINIEVITFASRAEHQYSGNNFGAAAHFGQMTTRNVSRGQTCMSAGLALIEAMLPSLPQPVIVDISGDGESTCSNSESQNIEVDKIHGSLDRLEAVGVRVNTLFVSSKEDTEYFQRLNVRGANFYSSLVRGGGFSITAKSFNDFYLALYEKLLGEIAMLKTTVDLSPG